MKKFAAQTEGNISCAISVLILNVSKNCTPQEVPLPMIAICPPELQAELLQESQQLSFSGLFLKRIPEFLVLEKLRQGSQNMYMMPGRC